MCCPVCNFPSTGKSTYLLKFPNLRHFSFNIKTSSDGYLVAESHNYQPVVVDATLQEIIMIIKPHAGGVEPKFHGRGDHIWEYFEDLWDSGQSSSHA